MTPVILQRPCKTAGKTTAVRKPHHSFVHGLLSTKKPLAGIVAMTIFSAQSVATFQSLTLRDLR